MRDRVEELTSAQFNDPGRGIFRVKVKQHTQNRRPVFHRGRPVWVDGFGSLFVLIGEEYE